MLKLLLLTVVIPCLIQVTSQLSVFKPKLETGPVPTTLGPAPDRIHPNDVVTDPNNLPCTDSYDCPAGYSCRDSNGNIRYVPEGYGGWGGSLYPDSVPGQCGCAAKPGEICVKNSECPQGYECYRELTGACCPPSYCVTTEYAQYKRDYWNNCSPPNCYFPA